MCLYWSFAELPKLTGGGGRNRTGVAGFAGRYLNHSVKLASVRFYVAWLCRLAIWNASCLVRGLFDMRGATEGQPRVGPTRHRGHRRVTGGQNERVDALNLSWIH